jgi:hypothetical protein
MLYYYFYARHNKAWTSKLVRMTNFWIHSAKSLESQLISKSLGASKPKSHKQDSNIRLRSTKPEGEEP